MAQAIAAICPMTSFARLRKHSLEQELRDMLAAVRTATSAEPGFLRSPIGIIRTPVERRPLA